MLSTHNNLSAGTQNVTSAYVIMLVYMFFSILVCFLFMLSIHNNLSAGTQNITSAYIIMLVYRQLLQHAYMAKQLCDSK